MSSQTLDTTQIEAIVRATVSRLVSGQVVPNHSKPNLVVSISARHVHLTDEHVEKLFGKGKKLTPEKNLYQDGFYAAAEQVPTFVSWGLLEKPARLNWHTRTQSL